MSGPSDVVVVVAHPDDEVFVSGTICLCVQRHFRVSLVCVTDGGGAAGEDQPAASIETLGAVRRRELEESVRALGIAELAHLGFADVGDPAQGPQAWDQQVLIEVLRGKFQASEAALILTHGPQGGYGHPAHRLVHRCVITAAEEIHFKGSIFSCCGRVPGAFFSWHFDQPSDVRIDARDFASRRAASLASHRSQIDFFLQPYPPRTARKWLSALVGRLLASTEFGRKRVPIGACSRFFQLYPTEGLALQRAPESGRPHFFSEHFADDYRVQLSS